MSTPLIVPVDVAALAVGVHGLKVAAVAHDFSSLPFLDATDRVRNGSASIAAHVTPGPNTTESLPAGVHLHWALPDALTRGTAARSADDGGATVSRSRVSFPLTPNRWLVVRIPTAPRGSGVDASRAQPELCAWVIESDYLSPPGTDQPLLSRVVPVWDPPASGPPTAAPQATMSASGQAELRPYRAIGRAFPYGAWTGSQGTADDYAHSALRTAVGYGTPEYAASYAHSRNVFGFHDPLDGIDEDRLAYVVIGWYSNLAEDPLASAVAPLHDVEAIRAAVREQFGWVFEWHAGNPTPDHIVCDGLVYGIQWKRDAPSAPRSGQIDVAVGNTLAEAVAALVAHDAGIANTPELETLLDCLQLGLLAKLEEPGGAADVDEALHQARFGSRTGGTLWVLKPRAADTSSANGAVDVAPADPIELGPAIEQSLRELNGLQREYDTLALEIRSRRERIYADWCKYMGLHYAVDLDGHGLADRGPRCATCKHGRHDHGSIDAKTGQWNEGGCTTCNCAEFAGIGSDSAAEFLYFNPHRDKCARPGCGHSQSHHAGTDYSGGCTAKAPQPCGCSGFVAPRATEIATLNDKVAALGTKAQAIVHLRQVVEQQLALRARCTRAACTHPQAEHGGAGHANACGHAGCACAAFVPPTTCAVCAHGAEEHGADRSGPCSHAACRCARFAAQRLALMPTEAPRFWQPNEPVLLLRGPMLEPPRRHGGDGDAEPVCAACAHVHDPVGEPQPQRCSVDGCSCARFSPGDVLRCRIPAQLVSDLTAGGVSVRGVTLPALPRAASVPAEVPSLIADAFFFDPYRKDLLAARVEPPAPVAQIEAAQRQLLQSSRASSPVGRTDQTDQPWIPLLLQWTVELRPMQPVGAGTDASTYPSDMLTSAGGRYVLDEAGLELRATAQVPPQAEGQSYSGFAILAGRADATLRAQVQRYCDQHPDDPFKDELLSAVSRLNLDHAMAQTLTGFNRALLMQRQTLQLPVGDPLVDDQAKPFDDTVRATVADANNAIPTPVRFFNPLRAGLLDLQQLTVADVFGQTLTPDLKGHVIPAESLRASEDVARGAGVGQTAAMLLPPRLVQPSRLLFRWLTASRDEAEMNSHPDSTPIFGWVVFNALEENLTLYRADGAPLGSLGLDPDPKAETPVWQLAPGVDALPTDLHPHLAQFRDAIAGGNADLLRGMLAAFEAAVANIHPGTLAEDAGLAVLMGRPFALARASLGLELEGLPALDQSWDAFDAAVVDANHEQRPCAGITNVAVPVRLGDLGSHDDGLLGWFAWSNEKTCDYTTFFSDAAPDHNAFVVPPAPLTVTPVASTDTASPVTLTLLLDPRGSVHATTGILPVKEIAIPAQLYAAALRRLAVGFLAAPVLAPDSVPALALPREPGYTWSWVTRRDGRWVDASTLLGAGVQARAPGSARRVVEGWLQLTKDAAAE